MSKSKKEFEPSIHNTKKENEILKVLSQDYEYSKSFNDEWHRLIDKWTDEYMGRPYGNEDKDKSSIVSRDIKKHSEWLQASILDPFTSTPDIIKCTAGTPQSLKAAKNAELILNTQFCRQFNRYNFLTRALKVMDIEGTCVIKTGWEFLEDEREITYKETVPLLDPNTGMPMIDPMTGQPPTDPNTGQPYTQEITYKKTEKVRIIDRPTAVVVRNRDVYIDPSCNGDFSNMQFIVHEYETDLSTLKSDGRFKNVDKIQPRGRTNDRSFIGDYSNNFNTGDYFDFNDKVRRKVTVREYWGNYDMDGDGIAEPIVCAWVDNIVIRLEENPYPDKKPPFIITPVLPVPFQLIGESNAELLGNTQKLKTSILRGIIDNLAASNNAQIGIRKDALDEENRDLMLAGRNFEFNPGTTQNDFFTGNYNQLPSSIFNVLQMLDQDAMAITGINTYGTNQTTDLMGQNPASSRGVLDGGNLRKLMVVKNISENLIKPLMRKWLEYDAELLPEESIFRITADQENFEIIRRDDLYGQIDIDLQISTNEDNAAKARELAFLLQTIGPNEDPNVRKMIMSEIARLHKMYDLANSIENYQPQPDPMQQELMQAQIENLKAQTQELVASAGKQQADQGLKEAKQTTEQAKAQSIGKDVNLKGLDFYQKQNRFDQIQSNQLKEKEIDERSKSERLKAQLGMLKEIAKMEAEKRKNGENNKEKESDGTYKTQRKDRQQSLGTGYSPGDALPSNRNPYLRNSDLDQPIDI